MPPAGSVARDLASDEADAVTSVRQDQGSGPSTGLAYASPRGRWVIFAAVLGSGIAFLDSTVVNVALPTIGRDLHGGLSSLQWVLDGYLLTLSALLLLGGALGDRYGRRRTFVAGLVAFTAASLACGLAPGTGVLTGAPSSCQQIQKVC